MKNFSCITQEVTALTEQVYRIRLATTDEKKFEFQAGQYLLLVMSDDRRVPLSIASAPEEKDFIELHIRLMNSGGLVEEMLQLFQSSKTFQIEGPHGRCVLPSGEKDVVFIAGGTGFSPMKSMAESALARGEKRNLSLYLGVYKPEELYQSPLVSELEKQHSNFKYFPVVGDESCDWQGHTGFPHQVALDHLGEGAKDCEFYISGSEAMVLNVYQALIDAGVKSTSIHSDILNIKRDAGEDL